MKIFKLFVCLSLILSISLINSFAAISVSDGSAFVTKAEFAADLNNLSNRMSSLENSLDAKIDSLVSSYLSRNGIWNGEQQTKIASTISLGSKITFSDSYNNAIYPLVLNEKLVKLSKSGLVRLKLSSNSRIFGYKNINLSTFSSSTTTGALSVSIFFNNKTYTSVTANKWTAVTDSIMSNLINSNLTTWKFSDLLSSHYAGSTAVCAMISRAAFQEYIYFFAEKDDDIYSNVMVIGSIFGQPLKNAEIAWNNNINFLSYEMSVY